MRRTRGAMDVELFFEERIHGAVQAEWKSRWSSGAKALVYIKAPRALHKKVDAAPANGERLVRLWVKDISRSLRVIIGGHSGKEFRLTLL
jgi:hypothetical protein